MLTLAIYVAAILILPIIVFVLLSIGIPKNVAQTLAEVTVYIWLLVIFGGAVAVVFFTLPYLRKRQALRDMKEYDFTQCDIGEEERFFSEHPEEEYVFKEGVFDTDGEAEFDDYAKAGEYLAQFGYDNLIYYGATNKINGKISDLRFEKHKLKAICKTGNGRTTVTFYLVNELILKADGSAVINGNELKAFTAVIIAEFKEINAVVRIALCDEDKCFGDMKFSARAIAALRAYNIEIANNELCDFILKSPEKAFKKMAAKPYRWM